MPVKKVERNMFLVSFIHQKIAKHNTRVVKAIQKAKTGIEAADDMSSKNPLRNKTFEGPEESPTKFPAPLVELTISGFASAALS